MHLTAAEALAYHRAERNLLDTWQGRVLAQAAGKTRAVLMSAVAHCFEGAAPVLFSVVWAGFQGVRAPFYCSAGRIMESGQVAADLVTKNGSLIKRAEVFKNEKEMETEFRRLADLVKLNDAERVEMFKMLRAWIVCDHRLDPTMNPADPDARRTVN